MAVFFRAQFSLHFLLTTWEFFCLSSGRCPSTALFFGLCHAQVSGDQAKDLLDDLLRSSSIPSDSAAAAAGPTLDCPINLSSIPPNVLAQDPPSRDVVAYTGRRGLASLLGDAAVPAGSGRGPRPITTSSILPSTSSSTAVVDQRQAVVAPSARNTLASATSSGNVVSKKLPHPSTTRSTPAPQSLPPVVTEPVPEPFISLVSSPKTGESAISEQVLDSGGPEPPPLLSPSMTQLFDK